MWDRPQQVRSHRGTVSSMRGHSKSSSSCHRRFLIMGRKPTSFTGFVGSRTRLRRGTLWHSWLLCQPTIGSTWVSCRAVNAAATPSSSFQRWLTRRRWSSCTRQSFRAQRTSPCRMIGGHGHGMWKSSPLLRSIVRSSCKRTPTLPGLKLRHGSRKRKCRPMMLTPQRPPLALE